MGTETVGKVLVSAKVESLKDLFAAEQGALPADQVRRVEVDDALVDTGAMMLSLPTRLINTLGLNRVRKRRVRTAAGLAETSMCDAVRLSIQGRDCIIEVVEVPDTCPVLVGQIPLEAMDFVVDPGRQRLIGNPEHGGEQIIELY